MPISKKLFAQICSDAYMAGAFDLEGFNFRNTSSFFADFVRKNKAELFSHAAETVCQMFCELAVHAETVASGHISTEDIFNKVNNLGDGHSILLPGGWSYEISPSHFGGHAVVYRFNRIGDQIHFTVHNSGAGLHKHKKYMASLGC